MIISDIWRNRHTNQQVIRPKTLNTDLPQHIENAILKALEKNRRDRFNDINEFIAAINGTTALSDLDLIRGAKVWYNEGNLHSKANRYENAIEAYDKALQLNPDDIDIYISKATVLCELKRYLEALDAYEKVLQLSSSNKHDICYANMGHILYELKSFDAALKAYEMAINLSPDKEIFYIYKGEILREKNLYPAALLAYEKVIQSTKNRIIGAKAWAGKGHMLLKLKCYPEAFVAYQEALKLNPSDISLYLSQGNALWKSSFYKEAFDMYERGLTVDCANIELKSRRDALKRSGRV